MERQLLGYWSQYCTLDGSHREWLHNWCTALPHVKRGTHLFEPGDRGNHVYFVCRGLLAGVWWDAAGNRRIDRFVLPGHTILTSANLYTDRQLRYEVVALRKSTVIRIPADALKAYKESCREADTLVDVMEQRKLKQYREKSRLMQISDGAARYLAFMKDQYMRPIRLATSQQEHADYLNISRRTISRAIRQL